MRIIVYGMWSKLYLKANTGSKQFNGENKDKKLVKLDQFMKIEINQTQKR